MENKFSMNSVKRSIEDFDYRPLQKNRGLSKWDLDKRRAGKGFMGESQKHSLVPSPKDGHPKPKTIKKRMKKKRRDKYPTSQKPTQEPILKS